MDKGRFEDAESFTKFLHAGRAVFTLRNAETGGRFTYRVSAPKDGGEIRFVSVLSGPDNESDYAYAGTIAPGRSYIHGRAGKARISADAPSAQVFAWFHDDHLLVGALPAGVEIYHENRCGRCGRTLTVPESVTSGFGPECIGKL